MPIHAVETQRLYRQIADQIAELIYAGEFPAGSRLPAERELAQLLGVSRPSVREALIALEIEGLVDVRVGSGIYVKPVLPAAHLVTRLVEPGPFDVIAARVLVEGETAALAAVKATPALVSSIAETLDMMEVEFGKTSSGINADSLFHLRIAEAASNGALVHLVMTLWGFRSGKLYRKIDEYFDHASRHKLAIEEHRRILSAIERHDPDAARAAMHAHLDNVRAALAEGWEKANQRDEKPGKYGT
jgi:DNA-binding FadR family transcriptional regulator